MEETAGQKEWGIASDIRRLLGFFGRMLSDDTGNVSSKRWVGFVAGTTVPFTWAYISIHNSKVELIPWEIVLFVLGSAGIIALGKAAEQKPTPPAGG